MLDKRDFLLAFTLHVLVVTILFVVNQWRSEYKPMPQRTMQVQMVSLKDLQSMIHQARTASKPKKKRPPSKPKKKTKPKAVISPKSKKRVAEEDLDYDPFEPLEAKPRRMKKKIVSGEKALKEMLTGQLTEQELNRYIAGMQQAVEQKWKVPMEMMDKVMDALVELTLYRNGQVASVSIIESSGSDMLDDTLIQAIYAAAPFELPDKQFELFRNNKIRFFPLK